ncbi:MAG: hypothetical protein JXR37_37080 [Kiritimatiellae bacterium]|nr:hypothetical protein [Kiritimatiellia bacterium]
MFAEPRRAGHTVASGEWRITRNEPNVLLLDWRRYPDGRTACYLAPHEGEALPAVVDVEVPDPSRVHALLCERHMLDVLAVNGAALAGRPVRAHAASQDFAAVDISGLLATGRNAIVIAGRDVREPVYLLGDFEVAIQPAGEGERPALARRPPAFGNLVEHGMPFYWGAVRYACAATLRAGCAVLDCGATRAG